MENLKCKIQWINQQGKPTPDDNPAIGIAYLTTHILYNSSWLNGKLEIEESEHFPICAEHAKQITGREMRYWRFEPYKVD